MLSYTQSFSLVRLAFIERLSVGLSTSPNRVNVLLSLDKRDKFILTNPLSQTR